MLTRPRLLSLVATSTVAGVVLALTSAPIAARPSASVPCPAFLSSLKPLKIGFKWTEGPAWDPSNQRWIFSDLMASTEYAVTPGGQLTPLRTPAGYPNGHALLADSSFVVAQHDRRLAKVRADGSGFQVLASSYQGQPLNSPNDVVVARNGDIYFTDPPFGITGYGPAKAKQELPFQGVFRFRNGELTLINNDLKLPNGIGLSPSGDRLYVSDTSTNSVYTINLNSYQGQPLPSTRLFTVAQIPGGHVSANASDGLKVDRAGNIWATGPGGIGVFSASGQMLCTIPFHDHVANLAPGGVDGKSVLVTAADKIYLLGLRNPF